MLIVDGLRGVADHQHQQRRAEEEYDPKVEVMDPTHYERAAGGEDTAASPEPELRQHPTQTHHQAADQAPERPLEEKADGILNFLLLWSFINTNVAMCACVISPPH